MELTDRLKKILDVDFYMMSRLTKVKSFRRISLLKFGKPVLLSGLISSNHFQIISARTVPYFGS